MKHLAYIVFAIVVAILFSCKKNNDNENEILYSGPMMTSTFVKTLYSENGKLKLKLESPLQIVEQSSDVRYPNSLKITSYNAEGVIETILVADSGKYSKTLSVYTAMGNVKVVNYLTQQKLETDSLVWLQQKKEVTTDKPVLITTLSEVIYGVGMTTDESFTNYKIWKMSGVFDLSAQGKPKQDSTIKELTVRPSFDKVRPTGKSDFKVKQEQGEAEKVKWLEKIKENASPFKKPNGK